MAKISNLDPITTIASNDLVPIVDADDTRMGIAGTNKKITMLTLARGLSSIGNYGSLAGSTYSLVTTTSDGLMSSEDKVILNDAAAVNGVVACNGNGIFSTATNATSAAAGLMSSTDKTRLDDASGVNGIIKCNGSGNFSTATNATSAAAGLMSSTDKTRLDDAAAVNGVVMCDGSGNFSAGVAGMTYLTSKTASGNSVSFTGIPNGVNRITIMCQELAYDGRNDLVKVQIGDSGGIEKSGYDSTLTHTTRTESGFTTVTFDTVFYSSTVSFGVVPVSNLNAKCSAKIILTRAGGNTWTAISHSHLDSIKTYTGSGFGFKTLTGTLSQLRIITGTGISADGDEAFTGGTIYVMYE